MAWTVNSERFKEAMSTLPTGVTVVTTSYNNKIFGFTASSFTSVSLSPPLVSFCINKGSSSVSSFTASDYFAVNILAEDQVNFSRHFAKFHTDKFANIPYTIGKYAHSPLIMGSASYIECKKFAQYQVGDHTIVVGEVVNTKVNNDSRPLVYYLRQYRGVK